MTDDEPITLCERFCIYAELVITKHRARHRCD
jgi:hypothetical protein